MTEWNLAWVLPSRCGGSFTAGPFAFLPINTKDFAVDFLGLFNRCSVLPMIHMPGVARFTIDRSLNVKVIAKLNNVNEAIIRIDNIRSIRYLLHLVSRLKCKGDICFFKGDVPMLDVERFRLKLPIVIRIRLGEKTLTL